MLFLPLSEIGLRIVLGLGNPILYEPDPACGYFMRPNQHTRRLLARTVTNSHGMRSPEFALDKNTLTLRLLFLGDSITYGTTRVDQNDIFVEQVRKNLSMEIHRPVEEINASANAWAIENEYGFLRSRGTYNSDYVLLVLNSGDLAQPISTLSEVQGAFTTAPSTAIGELLVRVLFRNRQDAGTAVQNAPDTEQANLQELTSMVKFVRARGSEFLLVFVPFRREIARGATRSVPQGLKNWADSQGVVLLDLTGSMSAYDTKAITLRDGIHFNKLGNRLLADSLEKDLADVYFAKSGSTESRTIKTSGFRGHQ
jgi:lysophospholipase L1-like esterase